MTDAWKSSWGAELEYKLGDIETIDFAQYGPQLGHSSVLNNLARFLDSAYRQVYDSSPSATAYAPVFASNLKLTSGASQSLFNLAALFLDKSSVVLMEDPTYFLAWASIKELLSGFEAYGVRQIPGKGLDVVELERVLKAISSRENPPKYDFATFDPTKDRFPFMLYCSPTFNNPTGSTLGEAERRRVVELAYEYGVLVVCDDGGN